jgi:uncharacterized protein YxeA
MNKKRKFIIITLILIFLVVVCRLILFYSDISIGNLDFAAKYHSYTKEVDGSQEMYIIVKNRYIVKFNKYNVKNNATININMDTNCEFAISLEANSTLAAQWYLLNDSSKNHLRYLGSDFINPVNYGMNWKQTCGDSNRRKNMYYKSIKKGVNKLKFVYGGINPISNKPNGFHFILNINVK